MHWKDVAMVTTLVLVCVAWCYVVIAHLVPWLWGPYARAMGDAGPLMATRAGQIAILGIGPWAALLVPLMKATSRMQWAAWQAGTGATLVAATLAYGYYLHAVVPWLGLETSIQVFAQERTRGDTKQVPDAVREAFALSVQLHEAGKSPWLPREWVKVTWPATGTSTQ